MAQSFGARMREQRERRQISLLAISEQTKIKLSLLDALERDDVSQWPTGIFRRAFIRAYAVAVDLDPDTIVREFLDIHPDPIEAVAPVPAVEPGSENRLRPAPPMRVRFLLRSAMDSVSRKWDELAGRHPLPGDELAAVVDRLTAPPPPVVDDTPVAARDAAIESDGHAGFGPVSDGQDATLLLQRAAGLLDAVGVVVWTWDPKESELVPALAHGYSEQRLAQFPAVRRDADNATAAAFRSTQTCIVKSSQAASGAVVVPLMTPAGCVGVLAVELHQGAEQREPVRALALSLAAQFAALIGAPELPHAVGA